MKISLKGVKLEIGFLFTASVCFLLAFNMNYGVRLGILFSLIHEVGHLTAILIFKEKPERISFGLFGMTIVRKNDLTQNYQKEMITALSGPLTNYIFAIIFLLIFLKSKSDLILKCVIINFIIGSFNIMPVFALDGGRAFESLLKMKLDDNTSEKILKITSFITLVIMMSFGFYILISTGYNFTFLAISVYLTVMLFTKC